MAFLVTAVRRPVAIGNRGDRRRRRRIGIQGTVHFLRIVKTGPGQDTAADQQGHNQTGDRAGRWDRQTTPDKRQNEPDAEEDQNIATRRQRPEVKADFPDAPDHGGEQQCGIEPQR